MGSKTIGGFRALVHGQDLKKNIKIKLDFEPGKTPFVHYGADVFDMSNHIQSSYLLMEDFGGSIDTGAVEFEIAWSQRYQKAFVKFYRVWINDAYIGCISSSEDQKNTAIQALNTLHPLLIPYNTDDWLESEYGEEDEREPLEADQYHTEFEYVLDSLNPSQFAKTTKADEEDEGLHVPSRIGPISVACRNGAIPYMGYPMLTNLNGQDIDDIEEHFNFLVIRQVLSQAFVLPLDKLLEYLEKSIQIGPLRLVPDNDYVPNPHPEQTDWVDGAAAWDLLYKNPDSNKEAARLLRETSNWFASPDKLDTGYEVMNQSIAEAAGLDSNSQFSELLNKRSIFFKELRSDILLSANQLGTGISQVLPIVVAANHDHIGLVSVEQPELHIHPRFQVQLADVFLSNRHKHSFLVETHSEHLILRLLRRIRETSEQELPLEYQRVNPNDVSVIYLDPSENGVKVKHIRIDEDGEFIDRWPQGFFAERREELM
ncbi:MULTISPECIES: DUF3696 domain-containing protein [unclassified Endozoicomonas]|uniref:DUF3696 domain-containing protein n=1 Tax=unclassified Endozoicomonas TaxID=2644528 RepID=UPI003BB79A3C